MKLRKQKLAMLLVFMFTAVLALTLSITLTRRPFKRAFRIRARAM